MTNVHNSVETVNAAATAIITAETRVQPSAIEKKRWGGWWSLYWCFGSYKHTKRIGHAVLVSEPTPQRSVPPAIENTNHSSTIILPFIAPPSSPSSFLPSDPPSSTQSPAGLLSHASLAVHAYSENGTPPIYTIGPYAHETQLVSPPVFSTFTTEPSTASFTPPPESLQMTTPSSPEVPFSQLLSSSLARNRRNSGTNLKYPLSQYEFQPYQYPGSPGGHIKSPGSAVSMSGTSSPFPDKLPIIEFRMGEAPKFVGYEHFSTYKWGSIVGSGSLTPNGWGSRLGSGALTPNSGISRLGSGTLTPNAGEPPSRDSNLLENNISKVSSLANPDQESQNHDVLDHHRVSFELIGEDIPTCTITESLPPSYKIASENLKQEALAEGTDQNDLTTMKAYSFRENSNGETENEVHKLALDGEAEELHQKHRTISLGSSKDFNFNNAKGDIDCEWWTNDKVARKEVSPQKDWTFFPMLQPGIS